MVIFTYMGIGGGKEELSKSVLGQMVRRMERLESDSALIREVESIEKEPPIHDEGIYDESTQPVHHRDLRVAEPFGVVKTLKQPNVIRSEQETVWMREPGRHEKSYVSKDAFETMVMEIFDKGFGKQKDFAKKIASDLGCSPLLVIQAVNKKLTERARIAGA